LAEVRYELVNCDTLARSPVPQVVNDGLLIGIRIARIAAASYQLADVALPDSDTYQ